jgi:hypothetical protein
MAAPAPELREPPARAPQPPGRALEEAILEEGAREDASADAALSSAERLLEAPWPEDAGALGTSFGARIGRDLSIVSVGEASRVDERSVRLPIVLGDGLGETSTLVLTIRLDALVDEEAGG